MLQKDIQGRPTKGRLYIDNANQRKIYVCVPPPVDNFFDIPMVCYKIHGQLEL